MSQELKINFDTIEAQELNEIAKKNALKLADKKDGIKTHQLRNVYSAIEKMRTLYKRSLKEKRKEQYDKQRSELTMQLIMLKPKIAYAAGRQKNVRYSFFPLVKAAVDAVENSHNKDEAYKKFFALMESVVAYHKFHEK